MKLGESIPEEPAVSQDDMYAELYDRRRITLSQFVAATLSQLVNANILPVEDDDTEKHQPTTEEKLDRSQLLPAERCKDKIVEAIRKHSSTIITGPTGSGKTICVPQMIVELLDSERGVDESGEATPTTAAGVYLEGQIEYGHVIVTEPRILATRSTAEYVAARQNVEIGGYEVGYQYRGNHYRKKLSGNAPLTKLNFVTNGILQTELMYNPLLEGYSVVVIDEVHENNSQDDVNLSLLKHIQQERERLWLPSLKIVLLSATLDVEKYQGFLPNAAVESIEGRPYDTEIHHLEQTPSREALPQMAAYTVKNIIEDSEKDTGDILIFMPGKDMLYATEKAINALSLQDDIRILFLHGSLDKDEQDIIFSDYPGTTIVIATKIAETSITVPKIRYVIDSGLDKNKRILPRQSISEMQVVEASQSSAIQRAGRVGRTQPGECFRLFSQETFENKPAHPEAGINRLDLSYILLLYFSLSERLSLPPLHEFDFVHSLPDHLVKSSIQNLRILGAIDEENRITEVGLDMSEIPIDPQHAKILVEARNSNCLIECIIIVCFLRLKQTVFLLTQSMKQKRTPEAAEQASRVLALHAKFVDPTSDFLTYLNIWLEYIQQEEYQKDAWAKKNGLKPNALESIRKDVELFVEAFESQFGYMGLNGEELEFVPQSKHDAIKKAITAGFAYNIMIREKMQKRRVIDNAGSIYIHRTSTNFETDDPYTVCSEVLRIPKRNGGKIRNAICTQSIPLSYIEEIAPQLIAGTSYEIRQNPANQKDTLRKDVRFSCSPDVVHPSTVMLTNEQEISDFAHLLRTNESLRSIFPFIGQNEAMYQSALTLAERSSEIQESGITLSPQTLTDFYIHQLQRSVHKQDIAMLREDAHMIATLHDFLPLDNIEDIQRDHPDKIEIPRVGKKRLKYSKDQNGDIQISVSLTGLQFKYVLEPLFTANPGKPVTILVNGRVKEVQKPKYS